MDIHTTKTTIEIDKNILYQVKMKALQEGKTLKDYITESLVMRTCARPLKMKKKQNSKIGGYNLGVKNSLRRVDIYENF